jgi:hypothetical protein
MKASRLPDGGSNMSAPLLPLGKFSDDDTAHFGAFLFEWWTTHGSAPVMAKRLMDTARNHPLPLTAKSDQGQLVQLGRLIASIVDRRFTVGNSLQLAVHRAGDYRKVALRRLEPCGSPPDSHLDLRPDPQESTADEPR